MNAPDYLFPFEKLRVWQQAREWVGTIYDITANFPKTEQFNLVSQMNRAAVSVAANLAEGSARNTGKDQGHFSGVAYSSLMESACLLVLATDQGYMTTHSLAAQRQEITSLANQINALRKTQLRS